MMNEATAMGDAGQLAAAAAAAAGAAAGNSAAAAGGATSASQAQGSAQSLDFILDIPLTVTVELGRSRMAIRDLLQLAQGSVVELSKFAGEPLEVLVNEKLVARGEVVIVEDRLGITMTEIIKSENSAGIN